MQTAKSERTKRAEFGRTRSAREKHLGRENDERVSAHNHDSGRIEAAQSAITRQE